MDPNYHGPPSPSEDEYVHRFPPDWRADEEQLTRCTHAVAIVTDRRPEQFDVGIQRIVDPDALDRLFTSEAGGEDAQLSLVVSDLTLQIRADGAIFVVE
ncbi:hypothetical protein DJ82_04150 [Halorubrum sp. Ib24]|uniref:HalOD1 output domain-containing protein n=1 Tax=unclassified Halorubrum TaxID=2642239 RepID=UPI000B98E4CE|nr:MULTISPECIES: HalOD1 output domain-containing protein [unclassified Halorubrum]OYR39215.1 hypothetical protein DJ75_17265 [Halorubrum sp. Eb13]OYR41825.1 hypothetical protein DJ82_04150 [Halorubrum sp. Ib24]OYR45563.1 hypothetical protein DJ81_04480 [Halorubrum sp. Hd13]OYR47932.1 hypothetical protein DJ74_11955 [Halorubrum sp. Ea8]OYR53218.1 hypothetical protein DJ73_08555 [Halorubrum sp. Ea1]